MKVLMINGSPHEHGCTRAALDEAAKGLAEFGVEADVLWIGRGDVPGCSACGACSRLGKCAVDDGVNAAIEKMRESDGLIVGSPVYYASPAGQLLSFLDRLFYAGDDFALKPAAAVVNARRGGTTAAFDALNKYFTIAQMPVVSSTYWNQTHGYTPEQQANDAEGLQTMRNLGRNMGWLLRSIEAGRAAGVELPKTEKDVVTNFIK